MPMTQTISPDGLATFNVLLRQLEEEASLFERLSHLLDCERDVLKSLRAPELGEVNDEKERILSLIDRVGEARARSLEELTEHLGLQEDTPTVSRLLDCLPPLEHRSLNDARHRLVRVAQMVRRRGELSEKLLNASLDAIAGVLERLRQESAGQGPVYGDEGAVARGRAAGTILQQSA